MIRKIVMILTVLMAMGAVFSTADYGALDVTLLNQDKDPAIPGEYVELRFKVEKQGNKELENIQFELEEQYPFSFDNSDTPVKELGNWKVQTDNSQYYTLFYKLKVDQNALEDTYNLTLTQNADGVEVSRDFEVRVGEPRNIKFSLGDVKTTPQKLIPDFDEGKITIDLTNIGEQDAYQVVSEMQLVEGMEESYGYSNRENLGTIEEGSSKTANFYIDTFENLSSGSHETVLNVKYKDNEENVVKQIEIPFTIRVFGKPQYEINTVNVTPNLRSQSAGDAFIEITNVGEQDADLVSVQIFKDSSQPFSFDEKSDFIGKLEQGDSGQALFNFDVNSGAAAKEYKLTMQIRSVVDGNVIVEEKDLVIPVTSSEAETDNTFIFIIAALIIGGVAGYFVGRKYVK